MNLTKKRKIYPLLFMILISFDLTIFSLLFFIEKQFLISVIFISLILPCPCLGILECIKILIKEKTLNKRKLKAIDEIIKNHFENTSEDEDGIYILDDDDYFNGLSDIFKKYNLLKDK